MRCRLRIRAPLFVTVLVLAGAFQTAGQEVIDRIAARVENDVILLSEVRELSRYQRLVDGKSESDSQILDRLVDQWIVRTEASAARFPRPSSAEVDHSVDLLKQSFASTAEFEARKIDCRLSDPEIREMVESQLYLSSYLDSRFRPAVQIDPQEISKFYRSRGSSRQSPRTRTTDARCRPRRHPGSAAAAGNHGTGGAMDSRKPRPTARR